MKRLGFLLVALALAGSGCSTVRPVHSGRVGLLDHWSELEEAGEDRPIASSDDTVKFRGAAKGWTTPLRQVQITSPFGKRGHDFHEGIDLRARRGTPVYSVDSGKVVYSGRRLRGYGNMVIVRHASGLSSVYAHNSKLLVRMGQTVRRGQNIAISGATGHVRGPHLHFEVRNGDVPLDPQKLLSTRSRRSFASAH